MKRRKCTDSSDWKGLKTKHPRPFKSWKLLSPLNVKIAHAFYTSMGIYTYNSSLRWQKRFNRNPLIFQLTNCPQTEFWLVHYIWNDETFRSAMTDQCSIYLNRLDKAKLATILLGKKKEIFPFTRRALSLIGVVSHFFQFLSLTSLVNFATISFASLTSFNTSVNILTFSLI